MPLQNSAPGSPSSRNGYHSVEDHEIRSNSANQKLSPLDMNMPRLYGMRWILCFPLSEGTDTAKVFRELKVGLDYTKASIPWLAGNIGPEEGVDPKANRLQVVDSARDIDFKYKDLSSELPSFAELELEHFPIAKFTTDLVSPLTVMPTSPNPPVMAAQANFVVGGLLLTVAIHHSAADAQGADNILETWAYNTGAATGAFSRTVYDPTSNDRSPLSFGLPGANISDFPEYVLYPTPVVGSSETSIEKVTELALNMPAAQSKLFHFSPEILNGLKAAASSYSTNDAMCGFIWRHMTIARNPEGVDSEDPTKMSALLYTVDIRRRTSPPLSPTYLGNAVLASKTSRVPITALISPTGHATAASAIRNSLNAFTRPNRIPLTIGLIDSRPDPTDYKFACNYYFGPDVISSSWADVGVLKREWGSLGVPKAFRTPYEGADGVLNVFPRLEGGGLEVMVSLEKGAMARLSTDEKFMELAEARS